MTAKYTLFSIDGEDNEHMLAGFRKYWYNADTKGNLVEMLGSYKGHIENSFMVLTGDFYEHVMGTDWVENQESIMTVTECNKMYASLIYLKTGKVEGVGCMHEVDFETAMLSENWTYSRERDIYWVAKEGNPDKLPFEDLPTEELIGEIEDEAPKGWFAKYLEIIMIVLFFVIYMLLWPTVGHSQTLNQMGTEAICNEADAMRQALSYQYGEQLMHVTEQGIELWASQYTGSYSILVPNGSEMCLVKWGQDQRFVSEAV